MNTSLRNELLRHLDDGTTGSLSVVARGGLLRLYVMNGEILASDSPEDDGQILRRTVAAGITDRGTAAALMRRAQDTPIAELLFEALPEDVAQRLIFDRFRENVGNWLSADSPADFEALPTIFHPNLQVGHDSRELLGRLEVVLSRTLSLRTGGGFQLRLYRGPVAAEHAEAVALAELVGTGRTVAQVLRISPFEELHTLDRLALMLEDEELVTHEDAKPQAETVELPPSPAASPEDAPTPAHTAAEMVQAVVEFDEAEDDASQDEGFEDLIEAVEAADSEPAAVDAMAASRTQTAESWESPDVGQTPEPVEPTRVATIAAAEAGPTDQPEDKEDGTIFRVSSANPEAMALDMSDDDLALFEDHDGGRGTNPFSYTGQEVADDRIDLNSREEVLAIEQPQEERPSSVQMRYAGPALTNADARRKIDTANEILRNMAAALDDKNGIGSGNATIQLLLEGSPAEFAVLFRDVRANSDGGANADSILSNLRRRPPTEHRRLLNRALSDLIERAMNAAAEELDDDVLDEVLESCAGYQQRLGL